MKRYIVPLIILLMCSASAFGQTDLALYLFGVGSVPTGDFGETLTHNTGPTRRAGYYWGDDIGLASEGFGLGAELFSPTRIQGLQWIFSSKILLNGVNSDDAKARFIEMTRTEQAVNFSHGHWINIPVMTGFRYDYHFTHQYTLYGILQGGINVSRMPSRKLSVGGVMAEDAEYGFARDFGYETGLGLMLNQTYNFSLRFLYLGSPRYDGDQRLSELVFPSIFSRQQHILGEQRSISMLVFTFGIQLFR